MPDKRAPLNKKILLVDDEEGFLALIKASLEVRGFTVITAPSAIEAGLALGSAKPDLVLMDIRMPGVDGLQACAAIKKNENTSFVPIIIVSALAEETQIEMARKIGVEDYLIKPVDIEKLVNSIKKILAV